MKKTLFFISLIAAFIVTVFFSKDRWIGYSLIPDNKIFDERDYALQGLSIVRNGVPIGYSDSGEYSKMPDTVHDTKLSGFSILVNGVKPTFSNFIDFPKPVISVNQFDFGFGDQYVKFSQPFLDHPPLGGIIYSLGIPKNAQNFLDITPQGYRLPALYLAFITSILIFLLAYQVFDNPIVALLSTIVYNIVPTYLLLTRYALLENVVSPLSLIMMNFLVFAFRNKQRHFTLLLLLSGFFGGLSFLAKESGAGFILGALILLIYNKSNWKKIVIYFSAAALPIIVYVVIGLLFTQDLFLRIFIYNTARSFLGSLNFINIFANIGFKDFIFDGWWIWGFVSVIFLIYFGKKTSLLITIPLLSELFVVLFLSGINYPWYYFTLIPYLSIAAGYSLWRLIISPDLLLASSFFLFPFSSSFYWGYTVFHLPPSFLVYRIILLVFAIVATVKIIFPKRLSISFVWSSLVCILVLILMGLNHRSILYIIANWGELPIPAFPIL